MPRQKFQMKILDKKMSKILELMKDTRIKIKLDFPAENFKSNFIIVCNAS